ncbi:MAG TPA: phosphatase PAP2 family protein [Rhizomicrobium sp.]|jgi:hypothetical protein
MMRSDGTLRGAAPSRLNRILLAVSGGVALLDTIWLLLGHFQIDAANYALLLLLVPPLAGAAWFYGSIRREPALSAMLAAAGFLILFSAACCLLSYLALTIAGPRIDVPLAAIDRAIGFNWPTVMRLASEHTAITAYLGFAYLSVMPQIVVMIFVLGWTGRRADLYGLCLALAAGALLCIAVWTIAPSFGAFSVYALPADVSRHLGLALDGAYGRELARMLHDGPGFISPKELRGIIGFPSYHTVQALVLVWFARRVPVLRWLSLALNLAVLAAVPVHGGHHLVDLFGGIAVTLAAILIADRTVALASRNSVSVPNAQPATA